MRLLEYEIVSCWKEGAGSPQCTKLKLASKPDISAWVPDALAGRVGEEFGYVDEARTERGGGRGRGCLSADSEMLL